MLFCYAYDYAKLNKIFIEFILDRLIFEVYNIFFIRVKDIDFFLNNF